MAKGDKALKRKAWDTFSKYIRQKHANHQGRVRCVSCKKTFHWSEMDCGHFLRNSERGGSLGGNELWYDERNFAPQCRKCNRFDGEQAGKRWAVKLVIDLGPNCMGELENLKRSPKKWTREELEEKMKLWGD